MSLRRDTLWTAADALIGAGLAFAFRLFVARLLSPDDFGIAVMALTVIALLQVVIDLGFNAALIQKDEHQLTARLIDSTFTAALMMSLTLATITAFVIAPLAASYYGEPAVEALVAVAAVMLLPSPFSSVANAMMMRARRFKTLAIIRLVTVVGSIAVAASLLLLTPGPWVVVGQAIAASVLGAIGLQFAAPRRYRLKLHRADLREVFGFSGYVVANDVAVAASANAGIIIIGRFFGTTEVGLFSLATYIVETTRRTLMSILNRVNMVHYAQVKYDNDSLRSIYLATLRWNCRIVFPVCMAIILFGPKLFVAVLGPDWQPMGSVLIWLSLSAMIHAAGGTTSTLYKAIGRPGLDLGLFLATTIGVLIPGMAIGAYWNGLLGVAIATALAKLVSIGIRLVLVDRLIGKTAVAVFRIVGVALVLQLPLLAIWLAGVTLIPEHGPVVHAALMLLGTGVYAAIELPRAFPGVVEWLKNTGRRGGLI